MDWSYEGYWAKAKNYISNGLSEDRDGELFPLLASLGLEFLARASLSKLHPVLVMDIKDEKSLLHVFGAIHPSQKYSTISIKQVFDRLKTLLPTIITDEIHKKALQIIERRNEELHSGSFIFKDLPTQVWLNDFYLVCQKLLEHQNKSFVALFGENEAAAAEFSIKATKQEYIKQVERDLKLARERFQKLTSSELEILLTRNRKFLAYAEMSHEGEGKEVTCPACGSPALIAGRPISISDAKLTSDFEEVYTYTILPSNFICWVCGLQLNGYNALYLQNLGNQYTVTHPLLNEWSIEPEIGNIFSDWHNNVVLEQRRVYEAI